MLRTAVLYGADAEWAVHIELFAEDAGLTPPELARLAGSAGPDPFLGREQLLIRLAEALHATHSVDGELWDQLGAEYRPDELVELLMIATQYTKVALLAAAFQVPVPPGRTGPTAHRTD